MVAIPCIIALFQRDVLAGLAIFKLAIRIGAA